MLYCMCCENIFEFEFELVNKVQPGAVDRFLVVGQPRQRNNESVTVQIVQGVPKVTVQRFGLIAWPMII